MRRRILVVGSTLAILAGLGSAIWPTLRLWLAAAVVNSRSASAERALGFTVKADLPAGWVPLMRTDMHDAWKPLGFDGLNYFTFGAPDSLLSRYASREDPEAMRYQAWFGIYVVPHPSPALRQSLTLADHLLANDQQTWLTTMGDPKPTVEPSRELPTEKLHVDGRDIDIYFGSVNTHSDWSRVEGLKPLPWLGHRDELPYARIVEPFHAVSLEGFVAWWYDDKRDCFFAIYGNGARFHLAYGGEANTWPELKPELIKMANSVRIESR